mmetsp:Transcript_9042/g.37990  ORF Transcript_9042/g.37990 Transcript_9042/m.37990 type:complete len:787 (-) Transcript_9042:526-2886(-)
MVPSPPSEETSPAVAAEIQRLNQALAAGSTPSTASSDPGPASAFPSRKMLTRKPTPRGLGARVASSEFDDDASTPSKARALSLKREIDATTPTREVVHRIVTGEEPKGKDAESARHSFADDTAARVSVDSPLSFSKMELLEKERAAEKDLSAEKVVPSRVREYENAESRAALELLENKLTEVERDLQKARREAAETARSAAAVERTNARLRRELLETTASRRSEIPSGKSVHEPPVVDEPGRNFAQKQNPDPAALYVDVERLSAELRETKRRLAEANAAAAAADAASSREALASASATLCSSVATIALSSSLEVRAVANSASRVAIAEASASRFSDSSRRSRSAAATFSRSASAAAVRRLASSAAATATASASAAPRLEVASASCARAAAASAFSACEMRASRSLSRLASALLSLACSSSRMRERSSSRLSMPICSAFSCSSMRCRLFCSVSFWRCRRSFSSCTRCSSALVAICVPAASDASVDSDAAAAFAAATASGFSLPMEGGADELLSPPPRLRRDRGGESDSDSASLEDASVADPSLGESVRIVTRLPCSLAPLLPDDPPRDEPFDAEPCLRGGDGDVDRRLSLRSSSGLISPPFFSLRRLTRSASSSVSTRARSRCASRSRVLNSSSRCDLASVSASRLASKAFLSISSGARSLNARSSATSALNTPTVFSVSASFSYTATAFCSAARRFVSLRESSPLVFSSLKRHASSSAASASVCAFSSLSSRRKSFKGTVSSVDCLSLSLSVSSIASRRSVSSKDFCSSSCLTSARSRLAKSSFCL